MLAGVTEHGEQGVPLLKTEPPGQDYEANKRFNARLRFCLKISGVATVALWGMSIWYMAVSTNNRTATVASGGSILVCIGGFWGNLLVYLWNRRDESLDEERELSSSYEVQNDV